MLYQNFGFKSLKISETEMITKLLQNEHLDDDELPQIVDIN